MPETIQIPHEVGGKEYRNHLLVNDATGCATLKLNTWEAGVIEEEEKREVLLNMLVRIRALEEYS